MRGIPRRPRRSGGAAHAAESSNRGAWVVGGGAFAVLAAAAVTAAPAQKQSAAPVAPVVSTGSTLLAAFSATTAKYAQPGGTADGSIPGKWYGAQSVVPVIGSKPGWVQVRVAQRPNGTTAWVPDSKVALRSTPYRIVIDRKTTHLALYDNGKPVFSSPAGIGTAPATRSSASTARSAAPT